MSNSDPTDTAITAAFEKLRCEVSFTRAAVEGLAAARERIPDYTETLVQIAERLKAAVLAIDRIEKAPAVKLSPDAMTAEIVKAGMVARAADARLIQEARDALSLNCGKVDLLIKRGRNADQQTLRVLHGVWAGLAGGLILCPILVWAAERIAILF